MNTTDFLAGDSTTPERYSPAYRALAQLRLNVDDPTAQQLSDILVNVGVLDSTQATASENASEVGNSIPAPEAPEATTGGSEPPPVVATPDSGQDLGGVAPEPAAETPADPTQTTTPDPTAPVS